MHFALHKVSMLAPHIENGITMKKPKRTLKKKNKATRRWRKESKPDD
jgi:hypothetical protein